MRRVKSWFKTMALLTEGRFDTQALSVANRYWHLQIVNNRFYPLHTLFSKPLAPAVSFAANTPVRLPGILYCLWALRLV